MAFLGFSKGPLTLLPFGVKVADKNEIGWVMKIVKNSLELLLDSGLMVLSLKTTHFLFKKLEKITNGCLHFFHFSLKLKNYLIKFPDELRKSVSGDHRSRPERLKSAKVHLNIS